MRYLLVGLAVALGLAGCSNYQAELARAQKNLESQIGCSLGPVPSLVEDGSWVTVLAVENGKALTARNGALGYSVWFKGLDEQERFAALQRGLVTLHAPEFFPLVEDKSFIFDYAAGKVLHAKCL